MSLASGEMPWTVLVPLKDLARAKSRLLRPDRGQLALAMAVDTLTAVLAGPAGVVGAVAVVTDAETFRQVQAQLVGRGDTRAAPAGAAVPAPEGTAAPWSDRLILVPDVSAPGLNPALAHAAAVAGRHWPHRPLAALSADLPALRTTQLRSALQLAGRYRRAVLADAVGTGTVLLTAAGGTDLAPAFGVHSREAHRRSGAVDLTDLLGSAVLGLRRDVDTVDDLDQAAHLGLGAATSAALAARRVPAP